MKFVVMGSGTSGGVPVIGCGCPVCASADRRDKRMRSSLYVKGNSGERIVIDTGPEFRLQALNSCIKHIDFVLITHTHADHIHGLDDLRQLSRAVPMRVYVSEGGADDIRERFAYIWRKTQRGGGKPRIDLRTVTGPFSFENLDITPVPVKHGKMDVLGWKLRENSGTGHIEAAYITDCSFISEESLSLLKNISCLILGALRMNSHETHFSFDEALETVKRIGSPRLSKVFFTHIADEHFHAEIAEYCARWRDKNDMLNTEILPAYDGLEIDL
ncbi:MAG: MBL fold metallo-hydrolase [Spirochaetaceae bacterium]|nr:MBL fold metallo-hydrolase [Spirochaetaceae bacterium]